MNILTLIHIIMETKEDVLGILQKFGINAVIFDPIQKGTCLFRTDAIPSPEQDIDTRIEIQYKLGLLAVWYKNWLTVYTEIPQECLSHFRNVLDEVCAEEKINFIIPFKVRAHKDLSEKQILVKVNFDRLVQKRIFNKICLLFQKEYKFFCTNDAYNEFLIDYDHPVDEAEVMHKLTKLQQEALEHKHYADKCGILSRKLDIPFINVLLMGLDENLLLRHQKSLQRASGLIAAQDKSEKKLLFYQIFKGNKEAKEKAIKSLGIEIGNADVMRIDFSSLKDAFK